MSTSAFDGGGSSWEPARTSRWASEFLERLQALILLGGSVRPRPLSAMTGRSILDLPLDGEQSLLNLWQQHAVGLAERLALSEPLEVRLILDRLAVNPDSRASDSRVNLTIERDPQDYRGTAGILRDVTEQYEDDDFVLVANGGQLLLDSLADLAFAMADTGADAVALSHGNGLPSGLLLLKCACLRLVPEVGYFDLKEQALPEISKRFKGSVVYRHRPSGLPIRRSDDYFEALRLYHLEPEGSPRPGGRSVGEGGPLFAIVEKGAKVESDARLFDSVVLKGGLVEEKALVARSIVCSNGVVGRGDTVSDRMVCGRRRRWVSLPV